MECPQQSTTLAPRATAFRDSLGAFPTGVTVVTAADGSDIAGMTLNSFTSVSLDPPLVLVCLAHGTRTLTATTAAQRFTVSVLRDSQRHVAAAFAANGSPFPHQHVRIDSGGWPVVQEALAALKCRVTSLVPIGDHDLVVGTVEQCWHGDGRPLVFYHGAYTHVDGAKR